jgi:putative ATPase
MVHNHSRSCAIPDTDKPLPVRMRPRSLDEFVGQRHVIGRGTLLYRAIQADRLNSLVLYGPPGVGKTSLAWCIACQTRAHFVSLNATVSKVDDLRKVLDEARRRRDGQVKTICFLDEIHRFNKAQQDVLLPDVEEGNIILIGATVHNPYFTLTSALLSRSVVCELQSLDERDILTLIKRAIDDKERGYGSLCVRIDDDAAQFLASVCEGDARRALNGLEIAVRTTEPLDGEIRVTRAIAAESIQKKPVIYDRDGDNHYDTASAFIKSMRGSDPDAALYWLAKMLAAGEDPRFIARRICILAAEDVGNADPLALVLANAALAVSEFVGMPEARIPLAQAVVYVSSAPKSNACYAALGRAQEALEGERVQEVPQHLKDASYPGAQQLGRGTGYQYAHDYAGNFVPQDYVTKPRKFYYPTENGYEAKIKQRLDKLRSRDADTRASSD